jgi:hypothetical protein
MMARYQLIQAVEAQPAGWPRRKINGGATIADTQGNALPGDFVDPGRCANPNINQMIPLDAAALAAFAAVGVTTAVGAPHSVGSGVDWVG